MNQSFFFPVKLCYDHDCYLQSQQIVDKSIFLSYEAYFSEILPKFLSCTDKFDQMSIIFQRQNILKPITTQRTLSTSVCPPAGFWKRKSLSEGTNDKDVTFILLLLYQDEWMTCQRNWLYLESIFSAPDIQRQLPAEAKMFLTVDKSWKEVMRKVHRLPNALRAATQPGECSRRGNWILIFSCPECVITASRH